MFEVDFKTYQGWITKYVNNHDTREINFQNDVVKRLLENLYPQYDIVCVDTKGSDSKNHDYYKYSGSYVDVKTKKKKPTTPDLLICKDWDWFNRNNDKISYFATVEVKSPYGKEAIYKYDFKDYFDLWNTKITRHLSAEKIDIVIFTDTFKWDIFEKQYSEPKSIILVDRIKRGTGYTYKWKDNAAEEFEKLLKLLDEYLINRIK